MTEVPRQCARAFVSYDPGMQSGEVCVGHTRIPALQVAEAVAGGFGDEYIGEDYGLTRREVLVCCAFVVDYSPPRAFKRAARARWKRMAEAWDEWQAEWWEALWSSKVDVEQVPFPPPVP